MGVQSEYHDLVSAANNALLFGSAYLCELLWVFFLAMMANKTKYQTKLRKILLKSQRVLKYSWYFGCIVSKIHMQHTSELPVLWNRAQKTVSWWVQGLSFCCELYTPQKKVSKPPFVFGPVITYCHTSKIQQRSLQQTLLNYLMHSNNELYYLTCIKFSQNLLKIPTCHNVWINKCFITSSKRSFFCHSENLGWISCALWKAVVWN